MKTVVRLALAVLLVPCLLASAFSMGTKPAAPANGTDPVLLRGYTLLHALIDDESQVKGLLKIKSATPETKKLIEKISALSEKSLKELDGLAKLKPHLAFNRDALPLAEKAARKSIAFDTAVDLVLSGESFELKLLLTQTRASTYAKHLAEALAGIDPNKQRKQWLETLAKEYGRLDKEFTARLCVKK